MRLFQNIGLGPGYSKVFRRLAPTPASFAEGLAAFLGHRYGAAHILQPVDAGENDAACALGDEPRLQLLWAEQAGSPLRDLEEILLAQIEHHRTEVFYNLDPIRYGSDFVRKLPGCVKKTICWRAAPSGNADLSAYDRVVCNFPSILESWRQKGCRTEHFSPAIDPVMNDYGHGERPIDVIFFGTYSRHHSARATILKELATLAPAHRIVYCLDASRMTRVSERLPGRLIPLLKKYRRPRSIAAVAMPPVWGRDAYALLGQAKIVLNGAIDMAGSDRGNMRCFEAMGCGALLLSDEGRYPEGMNNDTLVTYRSASDALQLARDYLASPEKLRTIALRGHETVNRLYNKTVQWQRFSDIISSL